VKSISKDIFNGDCPRNEIKLFPGIRKEKGQKDDIKLNPSES